MLKRLVDLVLEKNEARHSPSLDKTQIFLDGRIKVPPYKSGSLVPFFG
jgi:hypothetical protein